MASFSGKTNASGRAPLVRALCTSFFLFFAGALSATPSDELQDLGARAARAWRSAEAGTPTDGAQVASWRRELLLLRANQVRADASAIRKSETIERLLAVLERASASSPPAEQPLPLDREVVKPDHGATCRTAFGVTERNSVQVTLGARGDKARDAWYRFEAPRDGLFQILTRSGGPDPAIEVFNGCGGGRSLVADNDDSIGLDASVVVRATRGGPVWIHVANSGAAGAVAVEVASATTSISGTITDSISGLPLSYASVMAIDTTQSSSWVSTSADQAGHFILPVSAGSYYVMARDTDYVTELYPNAMCGFGAWVNNLTPCDTAHATPVTVANGASVSDIDVALGHGHQIAGSIRDDGNQPIASAYVTLYNAAGDSLVNAYSDSLGRYAFRTLADGSYKVGAIANGFGSQLYDHVDCSGPLKTQCDLSQGAAITIAGSDVSNANFNLVTLASIRGTVSGPVNGYTTQICVVDAVGNPVLCTNPDYTGHFTAGPLPLGTYYAQAASNGFFSQIYDGIDCPGTCALSIASAVPIVISQIGQIAAADFNLHPLPAVHGHVSDAISGLPLANVLIYASVLPPQGASGYSASTDGNGNFTLTNVDAGRYYVLAQSNDHLDQIYPAVPCEQVGSPYYPGTACDVTGATLLTIAPGAPPPNLDFALLPSSSITGRVMLRAGPGADLPASTEVAAYDGSGRFVASANTDALGNYTIDDLSPGTYYAQAASSYYYYDQMPQVWQDIDCPSACAPTTGTPIVVPAQGTVSDIDFSIVRRGAIVGRVVNDAGKPLSGVIVDTFWSNSGVYNGSGLTDALGYYVAPGNTGYAFFVATEAGSDYVDQAYSGVNCPLGPVFFGQCPLTAATPVSLSGYSVNPTIVNFVLYSKDTIFAGGFDQ